MPLYKYPKAFRMAQSKYYFAQVYFASLGAAIKIQFKKAEDKWAQM